MSIHIRSITSSIKRKYCLYILIFCITLIVIVTWRTYRSTFVISPCNKENVEEFIKCARTENALKPGELLLQTRQLKAVDDFFNMHNISYFLCGGSLLGYHRNKRMIPYDDDVDIFVNANEKSRLKQLFQQNEFNQTIIDKTMNINKDISQLRTNIHLNPPEKFWKIWFMRKGCENFSTMDCRMPLIDMIFYIEINQSNNQMNQNRSKIFFDLFDKITFPESHVFPLERNSFEGVQVWIPRNVLFFITSGSYSKEICAVAETNHRIDNATNCRVKPLPCHCLNGHWHRINSDFPPYLP